MMDHNIIYSEVQKLNPKKWIWIPMSIAMGLLVLLLAFPMMYFYFTGGPEVVNELFTVPFILVTLIGGLIPCIVIYFTRTRMKLELLVSKNNLSYQYKSLSTKESKLNWNEIESIEVKKYPFAATRPGQQNKIYSKGEEVIVMTVEMVGIEIKMKDGVYKFFTSNDPDALIRAIKSCDLNIQIKK